MLDNAYLALIGLGAFFAGLIAGATLALRLIDFAERKYADAANEPFGNTAHGDWPFVPTDNLEISLFHARNIGTEGQRKNVA